MPVAKNNQSYLYWILLHAKTMIKHLHKLWCICDSVCLLLCLSIESLVQFKIYLLFYCLALLFTHTSLSLAFSYRVLLILSYIHPIPQTMGCQNTDCTTVGKAFYFTFCGVAPSQWGRDILSAKCLRMNSFFFQTIIQMHLLCGLSIYLFCFFLANSKLQ